MKKLIGLLAIVLPATIVSSPLSATSQRPVAGHIYHHSESPIPLNGSEAPRNLVRNDLSTTGEFIAGNIRLTFISKYLVRIEQSADQSFINSPSLFASDRTRRFLGVRHQSLSNNTHQFSTGNLKVNLLDDGMPLNPKNISIETSDFEGRPITWNPELKQSRNLGGTLNNLDHVTHSITPIDRNLLDRKQWLVALDSSVKWTKNYTMSNGVLSRDGWFVIDDSKRLILENGWAQQRPKSGQVDWYFFGYGSDYKQALKSLMAIGGVIPMPRRYVLGSWYSRFWPYSSKDYRKIISEFSEHDFPLDMLVLDMDWHTGHNPKNGEAYYTGYTWNTKLFPDAANFLKEVHEQGLHVTLNDHPGDGVRPFEQNYSQFVSALGEDSSANKEFPFDGSNPRYITSFFRYMLEPSEQIGCDFWWLDWMGDWEKPFNHIDWVNELYFQKTTQKANNQGEPLRGQQLSRWADWGDHRHPVHFSGDINIKWEALEFEVPFTATSGNAGAFFWSHDIGGFQGRRNGELFARWAQFGAFSSSVRLHSTRDLFLDKRPWKYGSDVENSIKSALHLRSELFPYTYSKVFESHNDALPLLRPLYLEWPHLDEAYRNPQEYLYGDAFLVAPITKPASARQKQSVWFPPGIWHHWFRGQSFTENQFVQFNEPLESFPLFVKGGTPIAMQPFRNRMTGPTSPEVRILVFPGPLHHSEKQFLYEDDGETTAYAQGSRHLTEMTYSQKTSTEAELTIVPDAKLYRGAPLKRSYAIELPRFSPLKGADIFIAGSLLPANQFRILNAHKIEIPEVKWSSDLELRLQFQ